MNASKRLPETVISALTGVTNEDSRNNAYNAGVSKYLTKLMQMAGLVRLVGKHGRRWRMLEHLGLRLLLCIHRKTHAPFG